MTERLLFVGVASQQQPGMPLLVEPSEDRLDLVEPGLEIDGAHVELTAAALALACSPRSAEELASAIAAQCDVDGSLAEELVAYLREQRLLRAVKPAAECVRVEGDAACVSALRRALQTELWYTDLPGTQIWCLGALGSEGWRQQLAAARDSGSPALTWSNEGSTAWVGPFVGRGDAPCPACLAAWRVAVSPAEVPRRSVACNPVVLPLACCHVILEARRWASRTGQPDALLRIAPGSTSWHTLLPQPGCRYCGQAPRAAVDRELVRRFADDLASDSADEPGPAQRATYLDEHIGPIVLRDYEAPDLFRQLPVTLGSIRLLQPRASSFERRELSSVTFGAGATHARRRLVAFAEGIERYALSIDAPDLKTHRLSSLGPEAVPPNDCARFLPQQLSGERGAPRRYTDEPIDWSWACDWFSGQARLLAHDLFAYDRDRPEDTYRWLEDPFSSGAAAHRTLPHALRRALFELLERDALLLTWYLRLPLPRLDLSAAPGRDVQEMLSYLSERHIELRCYDLRVDFDVPSVLLCARALRDSGQWKAGGFILAPSSAATWNEALSHALQEILGHYTVFARIAPDGDASIDPATGETRAWWPNFGAYLRPRADAPLAFLPDATTAPFPSDRASPSIAESLGLLRAQLLARDVPVYVRYLAPESVRRSGLFAIRLCAPGLLRMAPTRATVNFGEPRIEPIRARWNAGPGLSPLPHPIS